MRPWLALALALLTIAGSAAAQGRMRVPPAPTLRGAQNADTVADVGASPTTGTAGRSASSRAATAAPRVPTSFVPPLPVPPAPPPPLMSMLPQPDPPACRTSCARSYYSCLSVSQGPEDCASAFGQCTARCDRTIG